MITFFWIFLLHIGFAVSSAVIPLQLTRDNWDKTLQGEWVIKFYAPWCPACRAIEEDFRQFTEFANTLGVNTAEVDITKESGLSGRFLVTALPTIYHAKDGEFRRFNGKRSADVLQGYIEKKLWKKDGPIAGYRHPNSILMSLMAALFQISVYMKDFLDLLTDTYGFSTTVSYVIFGIAVVLTGLVLGLVIVLCIDCIFPPKVTPKMHPPPVKLEQEVPVKNKEVNEDKEEENKDKEDRSQENSENESESGDNKSDNEDEPPESQRSSKSSSNSEFETISAEEVIGSAESGDDQSTLRKRK